MAIATAATLGTFTLEWVLHKIFRRRLLTQAQQEDTKHDPEVQASPYNSEDLAARQSTLRAMRVMVMSYTFEIGIIFHSKHPATGRMLVSRTFSIRNVVLSAGIFIGITLGISSDADTVRALMIALFFHQGNEGVALGVLFCKAGYSKLKYVLLAAAFVLVTPIGVAIGIGVSSHYNGLSKAALGTEGVFDAVSAGILIYNGLCDLILPTFSDEDLPASRTLQVAGFGALYFGAAMMALIGKWA